MIDVTLYVNPDNQITGFHTCGHADYADSGYDIICSAVSAIVITTMNSIDQLAGDRYRFYKEDEEGIIDFRLLELPSDKAELLLQSMKLGLTDIADTYGNDYLNIHSDLNNEH